MRFFEEQKVPNKGYGKTGSPVTTRGVSFRRGGENTEGSYNEYRTKGTGSLPMWSSTGTVRVSTTLLVYCPIYTLTSDSAILLLLLVPPFYVVDT